MSEEGIGFIGFVFGLAFGIALGVFGTSTVQDRAASECAKQHNVYACEMTFIPKDPSHD